MTQKQTLSKYIWHQRSICFRMTLKMISNLFLSGEEYKWYPQAKISKVPAGLDRVNVS